MITVTFDGLDEVSGWLNSLPAELQTALLAKASTLADILQSDVRDNKLSGQVLNDRSGTLKNSIASAVEQNGDTISASVFTANNVPYAAIQEYGGTTKAHVINVVNAKALSFVMQGKASFFTHVNHPGSVISARSYLESALLEMQDDIISEFSDSANEVIKS